MLNGVGRPILILSGIIPSKGNHGLCGIEKVRMLWHSSLNICFFTIHEMWRAPPSLVTVNSSTVWGCILELWAEINCCLLRCFSQYFILAVQRSWFCPELAPKETHFILGCLHLLGYPSFVVICSHSLSTGSQNWAQDTHSFSSSIF